DRTFTIAALFAKVTFVDNQATEFTALGGASLEAAGLRLTLPPTYTGVISDLDEQSNTLYTTQALPEGAALAGQPITLHNPAYSRGTSYRIASISSENDRYAIHLAPTTFQLARGRMTGSAKDNHTLPNTIPLEYAKSVTRKSTHFFQGKLL